MLPSNPCDDRLRVRPDNQFPQLIHTQDAKSEGPWNEPEFDGDGSRTEHSLQAGSVQVNNGDDYSHGHSERNPKVLTRTPKRVGIDDRDTSVTSREKTTVLQEDHSDVVDTLALIDEMVKLILAETLPTLRPLVENENDMVEAQSLLVHVQEPHGHSARPHHQTNEQVNLEEELPVRQTICTGITWFTSHQVGFGLLVHQGDTHDDVVSDTEANLLVRAQGELHSQEDVREDGHELHV